MVKRRYFHVYENPNSDISNMLREIGEYEKNIKNNLHKYNAYRRAAGILAKQSSRVRSKEEAIRLFGIGKSIADKIDEYLRTGKMKQLEIIRQHPKHKAIMELTLVHGIGPIKAKKLIKQGVMSIKDLTKHQHLLTQQQIIGLKYFHDFQQKIANKEVEQAENVVKRELHYLDQDYRITVCGSYRRGKLESDDIDILLTHKRYVTKIKTRAGRGGAGNYLKTAVSALKQIHFITDIISMGKVKFIGVCKVRTLMRRLDIKLYSQNEYYCALLYYTGNDMFNIAMRKYALSKGFTLSEYSLRRIKSNGQPGRPVKINSEKEIFDRIGYPYIEPEDRNY